MRDPDEDVAFEIMRQKRLDNDELPLTRGTYETRRQARLIGDWTNASITTQIHQTVGVAVPFSRMVDKDPWKDIPLSVPQDSPVVIEAIAWSIIAAGVGLVYWWVA